MHQIVLLTALTATSGLFGGGRHCGMGRGGALMRGHHMTACAPSYGYQYGAYQHGTPCGAPGTPCGASYAPPMHAAPQAPAPAPAAPQAPAPQAAYAPATQAAFYPSFYAGP